MRHDEWFKSDPAKIIDLARDGVVPALVNDYCGDWRGEDDWNQRQVFQSLLMRALDLGAHTAVIESRYTDVDFRDEHARFYSQTFRHYPPTSHRLHFFKEDPPHDIYSPEVAVTFDKMTYLGYTVLRPVPGAAVGRTMLAVPENMSTAVTCSAEDKVNFFGKTHKVIAAPFMAQDNQLGVCAHAATWITAYYHHLRYGARRFLPGDIADGVNTALNVGRSVPTPGMKVEQVSDVLESIGLPPIVYWTTEAAPRDTDKIVRRYLDSGIPLLVAFALRRVLAVWTPDEAKHRGECDRRIHRSRQSRRRGSWAVPRQHVRRAVSGLHPPNRPGSFASRS